MVKYIRKARAHGFIPVFAGRETDMDNILEMHLNEHSREEIIDPLLSDFPYVCSRAYLNRYHVFWHWHKAVELFYVDSGALEYDTPQGRAAFPAGSGGLVNMDILHASRPQKDSYHTIQLLHIFDADFFSSSIIWRTADMARLI